MKMLYQKISNSKGFSLLEVMFALALIGISLATLLAAQSQGLGLANEAKFNTTAGFLAQRKMAELETVEIDNLMSDSGDFDELYPEYYWEVDINETELPGLEKYADHFKQIDLHIYFGEKHIFQYDLRLYKFVP